MNKKTALSVVLAITIASSGAAFAQAHGDRDDRGGKQSAQRGDRDDRRGHDARKSNDRRNDMQRGNDHARGHDRGAGPNRNFYRGGRLPDQYRHRHYVIDDWRGHSLSAPPRGYHWVQTGGDYVLVAVASGLIMQIMLGN